MNRADKEFDVNDLIKDRDVTKDIYVKGVGRVIEYGELDMDKMVDMLLKNPYIIN